MSMTRRQMLLAGLGLLVGGCTSTGARLTDRPRTTWPTDTSAPRDAGRAVEPAVPAPPAERGPAGPLDAIARQKWASRGAVRGRVNAMDGINRITVHHEGWTPVWFTDYQRTAKRIEHDRHIHVDDRGWGDIGYHYIIDRAGRVWEGRDLRYQGAHVSEHNEHNLGIMCLGNFDRQKPTEAQLRTLIDTLQTLRKTYSVPVSRIYTHQELTPTRCPGSNLQPRMVSIRERGYLA
ncbi:MAG: peptidoglycan recognition family protein [bacterium]